MSCRGGALFSELVTRGAQYDTRNMPPMNFVLATPTNFCMCCTYALCTKTNMCYCISKSIILTGRYSLELSGSQNVASKRKKWSQYNTILYYNTLHYTIPVLYYTLLYYTTLTIFILYYTIPVISQKILPQRAKTNCKPYLYLRTSPTYFVEAGASREHLSFVRTAVLNNGGGGFLSPTPCLCLRTPKSIQHSRRTSPDSFVVPS